jgi:hypothetical protein
MRKKLLSAMLAAWVAAPLAGPGLVHAQDKEPLSKDDLFGLDEKEDDKKDAATPADKPVGDVARPAAGKSVVTGWVQFEGAYTVADPDHLSKAAARVYLETNGRLSDRIKYKASVRLDHEGKYAFTNFYDGVPREQRSQAQLRETYLDLEAGNWAWRVGRQNIVWGEMVGLFFADVVSAKDMREFVLPDFDRIRIPQWAVRAEHYGEKVHSEFVWVVTPTVNELGKPVSDDFYPYPVAPPLPATFQDAKERRRLRDGNIGVRFSGQAAGWDWSGFAYRATDTEPTFYRDVVAGPVPSFNFRPQFDRVTQVGGTLSKDLGTGIVKGEVVHTRGRSFEVLDLTTPGGVARQDIVDWALGWDMNVGRDLMVNAQLFQRAFLDAAPNSAYDRNESGASLLLRYPFNSQVRAEVLAIASLNRRDWMLRPAVTVNFAKQWRAVLGVDIFKGQPGAFFGRYDANDRVYGELRYTF